MVVWASSQVLICNGLMLTFIIEKSYNQTSETMISLLRLHYTCTIQRKAFMGTIIIWEHSLLVL